MSRTDRLLRLIEGFQGAAFGLADGVICILGLIIGTAVATWDLKIILVAAITGGLTDALGNSIGFYLSELSERGAQIHSLEHGKKASVHSMSEVVMSGIFSFLATVFVLLIFLIPFVFFNITAAVAVASIEATIVLVSLGLYVGKMSNEDPLRTAIKYVALGIIGATFSYIVGDLLKIWLLSM